MTTASVPETIVLRADHLVLRWSDSESQVQADTLRAACRCADCRAAGLRGEGPPRSEGVRLTGAAPVGQYALQLTFSDGHDRGIYPWALLHELAH